MNWSFETDAEFQEELDWAARFVREQVEPLDHVLGSLSEVHKITLAQQTLRDYSGYEGVFPDYHLPSRQMAAETVFADALQSLVEA